MDHSEVYMDGETYEDGIVLFYFKLKHLGKNIIVEKTKFNDTSYTCGSNIMNWYNYFYFHNLTNKGRLRNTMDERLEKKYHLFRIKISFFLSADSEFLYVMLCKNLLMPTKETQPPLLSLLLSKL